MGPIWRGLFAYRTISIIIALPVATIGYYIEGLISNRYTPPTAPVTEQREERLLANIDSMSPEIRHSPLEVNLPPSLSA